MNLLNLATFIALLVVGLQYIINNFLAEYFEDYQLKRGNDDKLACRKRNDFVRKCHWVILILYIIAIVLGAISLRNDFFIE